MLLDDTLDVSNTTTDRETISLWNTHSVPLLRENVVCSSKLI